LIPRLVIAGVASGVGKTTTTVGLCRALKARGLDVRVFKCGPDYLDPTYHQRAAEKVCHNLDGWLMGRTAVRDTFEHAAAGADVALIEGVMGLYDGASPTGPEGSTAEIAKWLEAPVMLVVDAAGMARSFAALAAGFAGFDPELNFAGVFANNVGSRSHLELLRKALAAHTPALPPLLGGLPSRPEHHFPERHLGLRTADRAAVPEALFAAWGATVTEWCNLDHLLALARSAPTGIAPAIRPIAHAPRCRIGIAHDAAFHFYYEDNLRRLEALGAELVRFSPLADTTLPAVDGLYIGGGYPEVHAETLAANAPMRAAIANLAARGRPIYGECGGLMYLAEAIRTRDGGRHAMLGLLPGEAVMSDKLEALGYVEVELQAAGILGAPGLRFRGHQFRYSRLENQDAGPGAETIYSVRKRRGGEVFAEGYRRGSVLGSYVHVHWASNPLVAEAFVASCMSGRST
jgi:cobyrinic acid a,c-diamide synthase